MCSAMVAVVPVQWDYFLWSEIDTCYAPLLVGSNLHLYMYMYIVHTCTPNFISC